MSIPITKTREIILAEAQDLFAKKGFESTSMADIAERANIQKASLYYFFKNKEDIFASIMDSLWKEAAEKFKEIKNQPPKGTSKKQYFAKVLEVVMNVCMSGGLTMTKIDMVKSKAATGQYRQMCSHIENMEEMLREFLKREGVPRPEIAEEVIGNAIHAYVIHAQCGPPKVSVKVYSEYLSNLFLTTPH